MFGPGGAPSTANIVARMRDKQQELELLVGRLQRANETLRTENAAVKAERDQLLRASSLAKTALGWLAHPDAHKSLKQAQAYAATARDDHAALIPGETR